MSRPYSIARDERAGLTPAETAKAPASKALLSALLSINWKTWSFLLLGALVLIWGFGMLAAFAPETLVKFFSLEHEKNVTTLASAALLFGAAVVCYQLAKAKGPSRTGAAMAAFFAFMALDELISIHERLEAALQIDWQVLYAPIILCGGMLWLLMLLRLRPHRIAVLMWMAAAIFWFLAETSEAFANGWGQQYVRVEGYVYYMVFEEIAEMIGSSLFLIALLKTYQSSPSPS
jgi:hypothetical protein